jgi:hypothetical protein
MTVGNGLGSSRDLDGGKWNVKVNDIFGSWYLMTGRWLENRMGGFMLLLIWAGHDTSDTNLVYHDIYFILAFNPSWEYRYS